MTSLSDPDEALATLSGINDVWFKGKTLDAKISASITDSSISRSIAQTSTFSLTFNDSRRLVARSGIFGAGVTCVAAKYPYSIISIEKSGEALTITFEDQMVTELQADNEPYVVHAGRMTHVEFVRQLLKPHKWIKFRTVDDPSKYQVIKSLTSLHRGTPAGKTAAVKEGTWTAINRIGAARGWRTFIRGADELWYVPDSYLFSLPIQYRLSEDSSWVDDIDYEINIRKKIAAQCQITARAAEWAIPSGVVVFITDPGPSYGKWIVQDITREPITSPQVNITLIHPQKILPEPAPNSTTDQTTGEGSAGFAPISSDKAVAVAQYAIKAGFRGVALLLAVEVSFAENGSHDPRLFSKPNKDGSIDRGLWQINDKAHPNYSDADMRDGLKNAKAAFKISDGGKNWTPWTTFNNGAYYHYNKQANRAIVEAERLNSTSTGQQSTVGVGHGGVAPRRSVNRLAADFVNEVLSQKGKPYVMGAVDDYKDANPSSFDCSSLIQWGAGRVGIHDYPRNAEVQYEWCRKKGTTIPVSRAIHIRGAILFARGDDPQGKFQIGHTAMSMGNGKDSFEALGTGYGTNEFPDIEQFTKAALIPGMIY
jgi:cell wall-associated NlpC family hydrolase